MQLPIPLKDGKGSGRKVNTLTWTVWTCRRIKEPKAERSASGGIWATICCCACCGATMFGCESGGFLCIHSLGGSEEQSLTQSPGGSYISKQDLQCARANSRNANEMQARLLFALASVQASLEPIHKTHSLEESDRREVKSMDVRRQQ